MGHGRLILQARIARGDNTGDGRDGTIDSADFAPMSQRVMSVAGRRGIDYESDSALVRCFR